VVLVHHTRKASAGRAADAESARGAVSLIGAARSVRVFSRLGEDEAERLGLTGSPGRYGKWYDDKNNLAPTTGRERYYQMVSYVLPNGESIGVPVVADVQQARDVQITHDDLMRVWLAMEPEHGAHHTSSDALHLVVARVMAWDPDTKAGRDLTGMLIRSMLQEGMIERATGVKPGTRTQRAVYRKSVRSRSAAREVLEREPTDDEDLFGDHHTHPATQGARTA
jgi:hypothetical protein